MEIGYQHRKIGEISLQELCNCIQDTTGKPVKYHFVIPSYQRGYRWLTKHVQALINDLATFTEGKYCLQPIVLKRIEKEINKFVVVDGQQRLTTLQLLLQTWNDKEEEPWVMSYESRKDNRGLLSGFCRRNTSSIAGKIDEKKKEEIKKRFDNIFFIWYLLDDNEDGHDSFQRLNSGKIPLTSSELIRAKLLGENGDNENKIEMGAEWERIEQRLRDDRFWFMFNNTASESYTRIDRLFEIVTGTEEKVKIDRLAPYYAIEKDSKVNWWKGEILPLFWMLEQCYNDIEIYHYIGWLRHCSDTNFSSIYKWSSNKSCFKKNLRKRIFENLKLAIQNTPNKESLENWIISNCCFGSSKNKKFFLLFNIETLNQKSHNLAEKTKKRIDYERFPFDWYQQLAWDIEHIASHTDNPMTEPEQQIEWALETYKERNGEGCDKLTAWISQQLQSYKKEIEEWCSKLNIEVDDFNGSQTSSVEFKDVYQSLCPKDLIADGEKNSPWNLTLLDHHTNRSYHNRIFPIKRRRIIEVSRGQYQDSQDGLYPFIPVCTLNVFTKFYTSGATNITEWTKTDAGDYREAILNCFDNMIKEAK